METEQLLKKAQLAFARYRHAVSTNKPLDVVLYWARQYTYATEALKHHTKWSIRKIHEEITGEKK